MPQNFTIRHLKSGAPLVYLVVKRTLEGRLLRLRNGTHCGAGRWWWWQQEEEPHGEDLVMVMLWSWHAALCPQVCVRNGAYAWCGEGFEGSRVRGFLFYFWGGALNSIEFVWCGVPVTVPIAIAIAIPSPLAISQRRAWSVHASQRCLRDCCSCSCRKSLCLLALYLLVAELLRP